MSISDKIKQSKLPFSLSDTALSKLNNYAIQLDNWNKKINLIGKSTSKNIANSHFIDSLQLVPYLQALNPSTILDIGTGAGFPGLPIAIALLDKHNSFTALNSPHQNNQKQSNQAINPSSTNTTQANNHILPSIHLIDPDYKRIAFLRQIVTELGLNSSHKFINFHQERLENALPTFLDELSLNTANNNSPNNHQSSRPLIISRAFTTILELVTTVNSTLKTADFNSAFNTATIENSANNPSNSQSNSLIFDFLLHKGEKAQLEIDNLLQHYNASVKVYPSISDERGKLVLIRNIHLK